MWLCVLVTALLSTAHICVCRLVCRASFVGGKDLPGDPNYLDDFDLRGLAVDTASSGVGEDDPLVSGGVCIACVYV